MFLFLMGAWSGSAQPAQGLLREVYEGIGGSSVSDLTSAAIYPDFPTDTGYVTEAFEAPTDVLEEYGQRLRGYLLPPVSGNYTFWIASDDASELWLSTNEAVSNRRRIAGVIGWTPSRDWAREAGQQSEPIFLNAGQSYYVEALMKEGGGGDNLAVRWLRPDGVDEGPIPGRHLVPWGVQFKAPTIVRQPANTNAVEGQLARFEIILDPLSPSRFQWRRNGVNLPGATNSILEFGPVQMSDHLARFSVVLTNQLGGAVSADATLTVTPDTTVPVLIFAENRSAHSLRVRFSEPLELSRAQTPGNYALSGGVLVESAVLSADGREVTLGVSALTFGQVYTLTVNRVTDRAALPNVIAANSSLTFPALEYTPSEIGGAVAGSVVRRSATEFDVTGGGQNLGAGQDQFQFASETRTGDFDLQTRVAGVTVTDPFVHAGLMVRESAAANARFAAVFASSAQLGCFFESRSTVGTDSVQASISGGYPVNYPQTWLRLRRVGPVFTGFASLDGQTWTQLGSVSLPGFPATAFFGMAVSSQEATTTTTAQFRNLGPVTSTTVGTFNRDREPLGPFVRSSGLVVSELMYHPRADDSGRQLEFIELYNAGSIAEDLSGAQLIGEVAYTFPEGTRLRAGEFLVVAANPTDLRQVTGLTQILGPYTGRLPNEGGEFALRARQGDVLFRLNYGTTAPWPVAPDGTGHSLSLVRPSYGPSDARAWAASERIGGSPGGPEVLEAQPLAGVVINEFLAHTDDPQLDFVELYNRTAAPLDLSGCVLTDSISTNRFRIPAGSTLPARGYLVFDQNQLGFRLSAAGESLFLVNPAGTRVIDAIRFGGQENGVSSGRQPDGASEIRRLSQPTPGVANATWRPHDIVINELMYHPISESDDDEYVELFNRSSATVDLGDWEFTSGISYRFPSGVVLAPGGYLVVAKNPTQLRTKHGHLTAQNTFGGYSGTLANGGERVALARPDELLSTNELGVVTSTRILIDVAEVTYADGGQWGRWADGGGSSLELIDPQADLLRGANWADSDESTKGVWTTVEVTGRLDNGNFNFPPDQLQITLQGGGEALVDSVEVMEPGVGGNLVSNAGFEQVSGATATGWTFQGNHAESVIQVGGADAGTRSLRVRTQGRGDTGFNRIRTDLSSGLTEGDTATIRARVRWITGWPEMLFRLRGNWLELPASLTVPPNLGTPGLVNSRRVNNAGPAIFDVSHAPALPAASQPAVVTARVSDPDGVATVRLVGRVDGVGTAVSVTLRDDGTAGDAVPGDGVYSGTVNGRSAGTLIAFRVEATDGAGVPVTTRFPAEAPARECLIRWGDPQPFGTFEHYHLWSTVATENLRNQSSALNNLYRDLTFVYGGSRVIYAAGFKDKGSPFKGGGGDWYVALPKDQPLLGTDELALTSTGNNGGDTTNLREQVCFSVARGIGAAYLHRRYVRLFRNGELFRDVMEDSEEPNGEYSERFFSEGDRPDLYKIEDWFEFQDDGTSFSNVDATLQRFTTPPDQANAPLKPARYRWSWRKRAVERSANDMTNLLQLVEAVNISGATYVNRVFNTVDVDQWMRTFAFQRIVGNWDSYGMGRGKNMYAYKRDGQTWKLFSWDVDFALDGGGNGPTDALWGAGDPVINVMFDTPAIRRRLWQAYLDAVNGPLLPERVAEEADSRAEVLRQNGVPSTSNEGAKNYLAVRRQTILNALAAADVNALEILTNGGNDLTTGGSSVTLTGSAPLALTSLTVNGLMYPVTWTDFTRWQMTVPLTSPTNVLVIAGVDRLGRPIPGLSDTLTVISTGTLPKPEDFVVINEIQYDSLAPAASFLELHNTAPTTPFNLSGHRLDGVGYTFPDGAVIPAGGYLVLARDAAGFAAAYGAGVSLFGVFPGNLDNDGETLALVRPDPTGGTNDVVLADVRYSNLPPWPTNAAGFGPSLQVVDPTRDTWRVGNWATTATAAANRATPGAANSVRATLEAFPLLWINEVLPVNLTGPLDNVGQREPFIELYNSGTNRLDLGAFFLTHQTTNLTQWAFPAGTMLDPGAFLVVWADGQPEQTAAGSLHTTFRLSATNGFVGLVRRQGPSQVPAVMDYLDYGLIAANRSQGSYPDGEPRQRRQFQFVTPGAANNPAVSEVQVTINEFMAGNSNTLADPADNNFEDWIELYNAGSAAVDLSGYFLTDSLVNWNQFRIPAGVTIAPGGFLLVWADGESAQNAVANGDLHTSFRLSLDGEQIGLFDPNGELVDSVSFGAQRNDVSQGRYPDGDTGPLLELDTPTPRAGNAIAGGNLPPVLAPIGNQSVAEGSLLNITVQATDPDAGQRLTFSLSADAPPGATIDSSLGVLTWQPTELQGPGVYSFAVRVNDSGTPSRQDLERITVTVSEVNLPPQVPVLVDRLVDEGSALSFTVTATDPDLPAQALVYRLVNPPAGAVLSEATGEFSWTPTEAQGPGEYTLTVRVSDGTAETALSTDRSFRVTVREVDNPPVITVLSPVIVTEGETVVVTNTATDLDSQASGLRFSLAAGAPAAARIDAVTGVLTWATTEDDGPGSQLVVIRVTQTFGTALSDQYSLGITVLEQNQAPRLEALSDWTAEEGQTVTFTARGIDPDRPAQSLLYSLGAGAPAGAAIDPVTGVFTWTIPDDTGAKVQPITVVVTDNGPGGLSGSQTFSITVQPRFRVTIQEIMYRPAVAGAEYLEVVNPSAVTPWNLGGLRLTGLNLNFTFPADFILGPEAMVCVARNGTVFRSTYGNKPTLAGVWTGTPTLAGDVLRLIRPGTGGAADLVLNEIRFEAEQPWPAAANGGGAALQLVDVRRDSQRVGNWSASASYNGPRDLVAFTQSWRYYQSGPLDVAWRSESFNDASWPTGNGLLYVESAELPAPKGTPLNIGQSTYYFRTAFVIPAVPSGAQLILNTILDDGAVFYLNGQEVFRQNIPADVVVDFNTPADLVSDATITGPFTLPATALRSGVNVLAVEVHQNNVGSSDIVFGASLRLEGGNVVPFTPGEPNNVVLELPEFPSVYLTEIVPLNQTGITNSNGQREPWLELANLGSEPVSLEGWFLSDSVAQLNRWSFPAGATLPPNSRVVVFADGQAGTETEWHTSFRLNASTGVVLLSRTQPGGVAVVDYLRYFDAAADRAAVPDLERPAGASRWTEPTPGTDLPAPLGTLAAELDGTAMVLRWQTQVGRTYRVEFQADLTAPTWTFWQDVVGTGAPVTVRDPLISGRNERHYRIRLLP
ncbi:MAG: lamin tail domain-containing protein [Verrucomicrobia bacterium]|nr:lamin tail domain-containing protein [Verrucomicrobiota bacterium]